MQVWHEGRTLDTQPIHGVQALFAYLVLHRTRSHAREVLSNLFWGEHTDARARSCLSTALWRLRHVLEPEGVTRGTYLVTKRSGEVGFNCDSEHWLDVAAFEETLQAAFRIKVEDRRLEDWASIEGALGNYTGDLLEGFYYEWALRERERLRMLYLDSLARLLRHYSESGAIEQALASGWRILELDPLREEIHREVMRLHLRSGHRALALQQYDLCREILARELDIEPMEETQALYLEIVPQANRARVREASSARLHQVLRPLRIAAQSLEEARDQLGRAIRVAEEQEIDPSR